MISHIKTMIPGFGRTGFGRDEIYPDSWIRDPSARRMAAIASPKIIEDTKGSK